RQHPEPQRETQLLRQGLEIFPLVPANRDASRIYQIQTLVANRQCHHPRAAANFLTVDDLDTLIRELPLGITPSCPLTLPTAQAHRTLATRHPITDDQRGRPPMVIQHCHRLHPAPPLPIRVEVRVEPRTRNLLPKPLRSPLRTFRVIWSRDIHKSR